MRIGIRILRRLPCAIGCRKGGFALITILLLMGFLLALVLSVSVLLSLDFQIQDNISDIRKAKANARIGLRVALGELQEKVGPDSRITAPGSSLSEAAGDGRVRVFDASDDSFRNILGILEKQKILNCEGGIEGFYDYSIEDLGLSDHFQEALGVLSNPSTGGLKKDLSDYLSSGTGFSTNKEGTPIFEDLAVKSDDDYIPKWEFVKSFYELAKAHNNEEGPLRKTVSPKGFPYVGGLHEDEKVFFPDFDGKKNGSTTPMVHGVGPVIAACSFGFVPEFEKDEDGNFKRDVKIKYFVTVVLWNPYDFSLESGDYLFEIKAKGKANIILDRMPPKKFEFRGFIRDSFQPGELSVFSLFSEGGKTDGNYNLLKNHPSAMGCVIQEQTIRPSNQREEKKRSNGRVGGFSTDRASNSYGVSWGNGAPIFSLALLSKEEEHLYQEIEGFRLEGEKPFLKHPVEVISDKKESPLFAIIFKNRQCFSIDLRDHLLNYNPRAPVVCPTRNLRIKSNPYGLDAFVANASRKGISWKLDAKDFSGTKYGPIFSLPTKFESLAFLRHVNFGALERHTAFAFGNSRKHCEIPKNLIRTQYEDVEKTYFYDYSYKLNAKLWDFYFLSGRLDFAKEIFAKNFLKLSPTGEEELSDVAECAAYILLNSAFNINTTSIGAWKELLGGLEGLEKAALERLASRLVWEVQKRGPFCTLGSFVNRSLENPYFGNCGALQAALDGAQINKTQAEILEIIGHKLAVRSDTFVVRAYGEATHAFSGKIRAKACCEARIQRVPEYLSAENFPGDELTRLSKLNQRFGRRFRIISFRWIN